MKYCKGCGYDLRGADGVCVECGRCFDASDRRTWDRRPGISVRLARWCWWVWAVGLAGVWLGYGQRLPVVWLSVLGVASVALLWLGAWRRFGSLWLLNPLAWMVLVTTHAYVAGSPGLRAAAFGGDGMNVDRALRVRCVGLSPVVRGDEWLNHGVHNATLRVLGACFGPAPNGYRGAYPTLGEANAALNERGREVALDALDRGVVVAGPIRVRLGLTQASMVLNCCLSVEQWHIDRSALRIEAAMVEPGCLLLRVPVDPANYNGSAYGHRVLLIDARRGEVFAVYADDSRVHTRREVIQWGHFGRE